MDSNKLITHSNSSHTNTKGGKHNGGVTMINNTVGAGTMSSKR